MLNRYKILDKSSEEGNFWPTFVDLLSGILLVIVIMMMVFVSARSTELELARKEVEAQAARIENFEHQIEGIQGFGRDINNQIANEFSNSNLPVEIDSTSGEVFFKGDVLFDVDKSELRPEFIAYLDEFIPKYIGVLLSEKNKDKVEEIIIEGHTDDVESYMYNLDLSQARAYSVVRHILSKNPNGEYDLEKLKEVITANGKSFSNLVTFEDGTVNRDASRRVEFKYRLKEAEYIEDSLEILN